MGKYPSVVTGYGHDPAGDQCEGAACGRQEPGGHSRKGGGDPQPLVDVDGVGIVVAAAREQPAGRGSGSGTEGGHHDAEPDGGFHLCSPGDGQQHDDAEQDPDAEGKMDQQRVQASDQFCHGIEFTPARRFPKIHRQICQFRLQLG